MCQHDQHGKERKFGSAVARRLLSWAHYAFRQRLVSSAFWGAGRCVIQTKEPWTSKTCGLCGSLHRELKGNPVYRCVRPECGVVLDRDVNGARNIGLLVLTRQLGGRGAATE